MKKNLYYRTAVRRRNAIKEFIFDLFLTFCSAPRLSLEVSLGFYHLGLLLDFSPLTVMGWEVNLIF